MIIVINKNKEWKRISCVGEWIGLDFRIVNKSNYIFKKLWKLIVLSSFWYMEIFVSNI